MQKLLEIQMGESNETLVWGHPTDEHELNEMFRLRYRLYRKKNLIDENSSLMDKDYLDENNRCHYFITKYRDRIIGSTRVIHGSPLPTEEIYFDLDLPEVLAMAPKESKIEIGRVTSDLSEISKIVPRHMVYLGTIFCILSYSVKNGITYALGTIKPHVKKKLMQIGHPATYLEYRKLKYNPEASHDPLINFFNKDLTGGVFPLYVDADETGKYLKSIFHDAFCFEKIDEQTFILRSKLRFNFALLSKALGVQLKRLAGR